MSKTFFVGLGDDAAQLPVMAFAVCQQKKLVPGMKLDKCISRSGCCQGVLPTSISKYSLDKVFSQLEIVQPSLLFDRKERQSFQHDGGEQAATEARGRRPGLVKLHPFHTASWRALFEDIAGQLLTA